MRTPSSIEQKGKPRRKNETSASVLFLIQYFNIISFTVAVLIFICFVNFILWPMYSKISREAQSSNKNKIEMQASQERYIKKLFEYEDAYNGIGPADKDKINTVLPEGAYTEDLFPQMADLVSKMGMVMTSCSVAVSNPGTAESPVIEKSKESIDESADDLSTAEEIMPSGIGEISVNISLEKANYQSLKSLLSVLENNSRIMDVKNLSFNLGNETAHLEIVLYFLHPQS